MICTELDRAICLKACWTIMSWTWRDGVSLVVPPSRTISRIPKDLENQEAAMDPIQQKNLFPSSFYGRVSRVWEWLQLVSKYSKPEYKYILKDKSLQQVRLLDIHKSEIFSSCEDEVHLTRPGCGHHPGLLNQQKTLDGVMTSIYLVIKTTIYG